MENNQDTVLEETPVQPQSPPEEIPAPAEVAAPAEEVPEEPASAQVPEEPAEEPAAADIQEFDLDDILKEFSDTQVLPEIPRMEAMPVQEEASSVTGDTIRLDRLSDVILNSETESAAPVEEPLPEEAAPAESGDGPEPFSEKWEPQYDEPMGEYISAPIVFRPKQRLRELKRKLIAGPEKRYYDLCEIGLTRVQLAIAANVVILLLCLGAGAMYNAGLVPDNRMRLMIFSQILAMLCSAALGCYTLMDGVTDLFKGRFTVNTFMVFTFLACVADSVFCLMEVRVPCCAAFCIEITMALWKRYHERTTEMGQMDTMRKATRLDSLSLSPDYHNGQSGLLRGDGQVEDFMDRYNQRTGPEKTQGLFALIALACCIGIAVLGGMRHGISFALQVLSTSLLVAVPAGFFIGLSRPAAILERRLHMTGTVLCGWQGIKGLCGKAAFPLTDSDLFPQGSTKLNGVKFYGDRNPDRIIEYAAALMNANGGCLTPVFQQLLVTRGGREFDAVNFREYPGGGIGGEVDGEPVLLGCLNFLQDMGVEIPEGTMVNQAVYCSIDGQLSAVFAIAYSRLKSSAAGLVSLCSNRRITPVMLCDDFMLTDSFLRARFSVRTRRMVFPDRETRENLRRRTPGAEDVPLALTTKDGLSSLVYAVSGARSLRTAWRLSLAALIAAGIFGMLAMAALAYIGSAQLLTPINVLLYQLVWLVPGLLITEWTRIV